MSTQDINQDNAHQDNDDQELGAVAGGLGGLTGVPPKWLSDPRIQEASEALKSGKISQESFTKIRDGVISTFKSDSSAT